MIARKADFYSGLVLLLGVALLLRESYAIDTGINFALGPVFVPRLLLGCIAVGSTLLAVRSLGKPERKESKKSANQGTGKLRVAFIFLVFGYLLLIPALSYQGATALFLLCAMSLLGERTPRCLFLYMVISVVTTVGVQYIFGSLLRLFLP